MKRYMAVLGGMLCLWALFPLNAFAAPSRPARPVTPAAPHVTVAQPTPQHAPTKKKKPPTVRPKPVLLPTRPRWLAEHPAADPGCCGGGDLNYYGGATLNHPVAYLIFWGASWNGGDAGTMAIVQNYFNDLPGTAFANILTQYFDTNGNITISGSPMVGGTWVDTTAPPTDTTCGLQPTVEDSSIVSEISHAIAVNGWPTDTLNATYFVYTPAGDYVNSGTGACAGYYFCAYHSYTGSIPGNGVAYAVLPYPTLANCPALQSPNGNRYGDSLVNLTSYEQFASITDQFPCTVSGCANAAWTNGYSEISDMCAWDFSSGYTTLGPDTFLVQEEYSNAIHGCTNAYTPPFSPHLVLGGTSGNGISQLGQAGTNLPSQTLYLDNSGAGTLSWSSNTLPSWVSVSPTSGSLAAGSAQPLTVSFSVGSPTPQTFITNIAFSGNADNSPIVWPVTLTTEAVPANDDYYGATTLSSLPYYASEDTTFATTAGDDPLVSNCGSLSPNQFSQSVWYTYTTGAATGLVISTASSSYNTVVAVFTGGRTFLTQVACNHHYTGCCLYGNGDSSLVAFNASAATTYSIEVMNVYQTYSGSLYNDELNLSVMAAPAVTSTIGVYRPAASQFYLRNVNSAGPPNIIATYGTAGDVPVMGDWTGQRYETIGIWRPSNHTFYLRDSDTPGAADVTVNVGALSGIPLAGDWYFPGQWSLGLYDPTTSTFTMFESTSNYIDFQFQFGAPGDIPVVGDWTGQGEDGIGVYRPSNGTFYLKNCNCAGNPDIVVTFGPTGGKPIVGDWTNKGYDSIGVVSGGTFYLRNSNTTGAADAIFNFGASTDTPLAGRWLPQQGAPFSPPHSAHRLSQPLGARQPQANPRRNGEVSG